MVIPVSASELQTRSIATPYVVLTCAVSVIIKSLNSSYDPVIAWCCFGFLLMTFWVTAPAGKEPTTSYQSLVQLFYNAQVERISEEVQDAPVRLLLPAQTSDTDTLTTHT